MAFLRVLLPKCGGDLDSLYLKELAFIIADIEAANKANVSPKSLHSRLSRVCVCVLSSVNVVRRRRPRLAMISCKILSSDEREQRSRSQVVQKGR
jgi:hypothetical protein